MAKVTSKLQVTIPKAVADRYSITPGSDIVFEPAGDIIRVLPEPPKESRPADRVALFDRIVARQKRREEGEAGPPPVSNRGWTREDLYDRGRAR